MTTSNLFRQYEVEKSLGKFNLSFLIAMLISIITASVSLTLLMQKLARYYFRILPTRRTNSLPKDDL